MTNNIELQKFISVLCKQLGLNKKILINENIQDVPIEYLQIHILTNAIKEVKFEYEKQYKDYLDAYQHFSSLHRKGMITSQDFQTKFNDFKSNNYSKELVLS